MQAETAARQTAPGISIQNRASAMCRRRAAKLQHWLTAKAAARLVYDGSRSTLCQILDFNIRFRCADGAPWEELQQRLATTVAALPACQ